MHARHYRATLALVLLGAALLGGCKFLSNTTTQAEGVYFGFYTADNGSQPVAIYGAILPGQYAYFGAVDGDLYVLPNNIETGNLSGIVTVFPPLGASFSNGDSQRSFDLSGLANASNNIVTDMSGRLNGGTGAGSFSLTRQNLSTPSPSLSSLAGTYQGYYWASGSETAISLTLDANGNFSFNDTLGCAGNGTLSVTSDYHNLLQISAKSTGSPVCPGTVSGLAFTDTEDLHNLFSGASGTYLYFGASNSNTGLVAELYRS